MTDTYIAALPVSDLFVDHSYQRDLDEPRSRTMAAHWDPRLAGVLDVSDRGEDATPRYAVVNGQHRCEGGRLHDPAMHFACNVHTGLTVDDEAKLFWDIDRTTRRLSTWDRWKARRASGDEVVSAIEKIASDCDFRVVDQPGPRNIQAVGALEWIYERYIPETLTDTLILITDVWPDDPEGKRSAVLKGVATVLFSYATEIHSGRLGDAMSSVTPLQLQARGHELAAKGHSGGLAATIALALVNLYNRRPGPKLSPLGQTTEEVAPQ